jgi:hypothetical protein
MFAQANDARAVLTLEARIEPGSSRLPVRSVVALGGPGFGGQ